MHRMALRGTLKTAKSYARSFEAGLAVLDASQKNCHCGTGPGSYARGSLFCRGLVKYCCKAKRLDCCQSPARGMWECTGLKVYVSNITRGVGGGTNHREPWWKRANPGVFIILKLLRLCKLESAGCKRFIQKKRKPKTSSMQFLTVA